MAPNKPVPVFVVNANEGHGWNLAKAEVYLPVENGGPAVVFTQQGHAPDCMSIDDAQKIVDCYTAAIKVAKAMPPRRTPKTKRNTNE